MTAYTQSIGEIEIEEGRFDLEEISRNRLCMPDARAAKVAEGIFEDNDGKEELSAGGVIACQVTGLRWELENRYLNKPGAAQSGKSHHVCGSCKGCGDR